MSLLVACSGGGGGGGSSGASSGAAGGAVGTTVAPIIAFQPQSQSVRDGATVTFSVSATGSPVPTFQWMRENQPIAGAQASTLTLNSAQLVDTNAHFSVAITNGVGSVTSAIATLTVLPQPGIALIAGDIGGVGSLDGTGPTARFASPTNVAIDAAGNLFVADNATVRRVSAAGVVTTLAGSPTATGNANGVGTVARFRLLAGIAVDGSGNTYVSDNTDQTIRKLDASGTVSTFAGTSGISGAANGTGTAASFNAPTGLATDAAGNVYVADTNNQTIRKITPAGAVTTLAGGVGLAGSADGTGAVARFNQPRNLTVDSAGNVYVTDAGNNTIRKITSAGVVTTVAGTAGIAGTTDALGAVARFSTPSGIAVDAAGNLYVGDIGSRVVRKVTPAGAVTTIAGTAGTAGAADGTGAAARFVLPIGVASDATGIVYVADRDNFTIRKISTTSVVTTFAGAPIVQGATDGTAAAATFIVPFGVAVDAAQNVYVADNDNHTIRKITLAGVVTTLAGSPGVAGSADGTGSAARFNGPQGIALDAAGNVYVADKNNQTIRKVTPAGLVTTLAGAVGVKGSTDGTGGAALFIDPASVAVDASGNVFVFDNNPSIRKITPAGVVTTIAGGPGRFGSTDGTGSAATFGFPQGQIALDTAGNVFAADAGSASIRRITPAGVVTTVAGAGGITGAIDGPAAASRFTLPTGLAIDATGNVYISDISTHTIRKLDTTGTVSTVVGVADGVRGVRLGGFPGHLDLPIQLAIGPNGSLYTTDDNGVLRITFP